MRTAEEDDRKLVCFALQDQEFVVDIQEVKESLSLRPLTRLPHTPSWLAGIMNLRGDIVAAINLADLLGMQPTSLDPTRKIIIAQYNGKRLGIVCDRLGNVRVRPSQPLQEPTASERDDTSELLSGLWTLPTGEALRKLDVEALFQHPGLKAFQRKSKE